MSEKITQQIRQKAKKLLQDKKAEIVIGYERGSSPAKVKPVIIKSAADTDRLIWNEYCYVNLCRYLLENTNKKSAVIAKGCDTRTIISLINENKLKRENIYILGVNCSGMKKNPYTDSGAGKSDKDITCENCKYPSPVISDEIIGDKVSSSANRYVLSAEFEKLPREKRIAYVFEQFNKCIRCYACREVCPLCYCKECFTDSSDPKWIDTGTENTDKTMYLMIRFFHLIGRCTDCGACSRVCPMGVDLNLFMNKIAKDLKENYDFESGLDFEKDKPLLTFTEDDLNDFIL